MRAGVFSRFLLLRLCSRSRPAFAHPFSLADGGGGGDGGDDGQGGSGAVSQVLHPANDDDGDNGSDGHVEHNPAEPEVLCKISFSIDDFSQNFVVLCCTELDVVLINNFLYSKFGFVSGSGSGCAGPGTRSRSRT